MCIYIELNTDPLWSYLRCTSKSGKNSKRQASALASLKASAQIMAIFRSLICSCLTKKKTERALGEPRYTTSQLNTTYTSAITLASPRSRSVHGSPLLGDFTCSLQAKPWDPADQHFANDIIFFGRRKTSFNQDWLFWGGHENIWECDPLCLAEIGSNGSK